MEARVSKLEAFAAEVRDRLARIETRLDSFPSIFATKIDISTLRAEMHKAFTDQTWRIIGAMTTLGLAIIGAMVWIAKNIS